MSIFYNFRQLKSILEEDRGPFICFVNVIVADGLETQNSKASASMILT